MAPRFAVVAANARSGGGVSLVRGLAGAAARSGARLAFLVAEPLATELVALGAEVMPPLKAAGPAARQIEARRRLRGLRPPAALLLDNLPMLSGVPEVVLVQNTLLVDRSRPASFLTRALWLRFTGQRARVLAAPSRYLAARVTAGVFGKPACETVHHGTDFVPYPAEIRKKNLLVHVSDPYPHKNQAFVLEALARLPEEVTLSWTLQPSGPVGEALARRAAALDVADRVKWCGHLESEALRRLYAEATMLVMPSFVESFGFPLLEAMRAGSPVVASDLLWAREVCGDAALYVDPTEPDKGAEAIARLLADGDRRRNMAAIGAARGASFTWDAALDRYLELLEKAANAPFRPTFALRHHRSARPTSTDGLGGHDVTAMR